MDPTSRGAAVAAVAGALLRRRRHVRAVGPSSHA
ncbi:MULTISPECIES: hypothetical protein [Mycobacterium avium complex (MAC)]